MTCFGTSASYIAACMKDGAEPGSRGRDLSRACAPVGSTGSPLAPEGFQWIYDQVGTDTWLFSTSGGTDVCTAFVGGVPTLPVYRGELQGRSLGCAVEAWDEDGQLGDRRGRRAGDHGADAVDAPLPLGTTATARGTGSRYFEMLPGVWRHGDWIEITAARHGGHLRPLGLDHQPRPGSASGTSRDLPRGRSVTTRSSTRSSSTSRAPGTDGLDAAVRASSREGADARRRAHQARSRRAIREPTARRATSPTRSTRSPRCRAPSAARSSRCR